MDTGVAYPTPGWACSGCAYAKRCSTWQDAATVFRLLITYLVHALLGQGPFPILVWAGQKGSAKSTASLLCKTMLDPAAGALRAPPRHERDLGIAAQTSFLLAYDNLSSLPDWLSDAMCRLSTGGAFAGRQLYTDAEEHVLEFRRPLILNGIDDLLSRADLADRAVTITLAEIPSTRRRPESDILEEFEVARPLLLGALLDLVVAVLRELPTVRLDRHPRMADFARTGAAVERAAGWPEGCTLAALERNRQDAVEAELGSDPIATSIIDLVGQDSRGWTGIATDLLERLADMTHPSLRHGPEWPNGARALSNRLRRLEPTLRHVGVKVEYERTSSARVIRLSRGRDEELPEVSDV